MTKEEIIALADKVASGLATDQDIALFNSIYSHFQDDRTGWDEEFLGNRNELEIQMKKEILGKITTGKPVIPIGRIRRIAVAAAVLLIMGAGTYFLFFDHSPKKNVIVKTPEPDHDVKAPALNRAMVTLGNGKTIYLDSTGNGTLANEGNVKLVKLDDGQIFYSRESAVDSRESLQYNTLTNPRGSRVIDIGLSDGSHVWLNAGSSVTYPVAFVGRERKVSITGEAYFEVSPLPSSPGGGGVKGKMPFIVDVNGKQTVQVLGTHFNIKAYDNEDIKTTLLEGKVKVSAIQPGTTNPKPETLAPGQQALFTIHDSRLTVQNNVDIDQVMAWKNGLFSFKNADIETVMREVARWYNVDVVYEGGKPQGHFAGDIARNVNVSVLMKILQTSGIQFSIEGRKVIVKP
jgi:transmembrane sensor